MLVCVTDENAPKRRNVLISDVVWDALKDAVARSPEPLITDRATLFREFARWYTRQPGARMPARPAAPEQEDKK